MNNIKRLSTVVLALSVATFFLSACSKTTKEYQKQPYNSIASFSLVGYTGDSITASVDNGNIIVYWAAEAKMPATITPTIVVSPNATISPASGTAVAFSNETVYTVTAQDGTKQTYHLKPVINYPVPKISSITPTNIHFYSDPLVTVSGEYFLSGDTSAVHVYAQRLSDGFEFDLPIDHAQLTMTNITASLPAYNTSLDTGAHKIWVQIGNRVSDEQVVNIRMPDIAFSGLMHVGFVEAGQTLHAGDSATIKIWDDYNGNVIRWYAKRFTSLAIEEFTFDASQLSQTDSTIKFKIPATPWNAKPAGLALHFIGPYYAPEYLSTTQIVGGWPVFPVKDPS